MSSRRPKGLYVFVRLVYFELKLRFPADQPTVSIGSSDGVSECRTGASCDKEKPAEATFSAAFCCTEVWFVILLCGNRMFTPLAT